MLRVIDSKILLANSNFEFVFLSINSKLILMSFYLELGDVEQAFNIIKSEESDIQFTASKAFYVNLSAQRFG